MSGGTTTQVPALITLRWRMVRSPAARAGLWAALMLLPGLAVGAVVLGLVLPQPVGGVTGLLIVTPSLLLGFLALSIIAPLGAGGGAQLYPAEQLVAFPISERTVYYSALLLAPLNLAWLLQLLVSLGLVAYVSSGPGPARWAAALTLLVFLALVTLLGQAVAWVIVGIRRTRPGRWATWWALAAVVLVFVGLLTTGQLTSVLDRSPTVWVLIAALSPGFGNWEVWALRTALMAVAAAAMIPVGIRACRWTLLRPGDGGDGQKSGAQRRRSMPPRPSSALARVDRASVWRATALRRGALLLTLLPAGALVVARPDSTVVVLVPALVAAGAGLLFAVNAFCLDASGALWLSTLPASDRTIVTARIRTVIEAIGVPVTTVLVVGLLRIGEVPSASVVVAAVGCALCAVLRVTALSMNWSIRRPHRADLQSSRDTPAPPGAMALYAIRLSLTATGVGVLFSVLSFSPRWELPALAALALILLSMRRLLLLVKQFEQPGVRARIVATVSGG